MQASLSRRGRALVDAPLRDDFELFHEAEQNAYDAEANPGGAIALCIAENALAWPQMRARLVRAAARMPPAWVAKYTDVRGAPELREALAGFAERHITTLGQRAAVALDPDGFCVASGATGVVELTALLLGDDGDVAAFPTPCYPVYRQDVGHKAHLDRYDVRPARGWDEVEPGTHPLAVADLDRALGDVEASGRRLRMLVLTQPDNPTGAIYTAAQLRDFADWATRHEVHLCVNELYALSQVDVADARIAGDYADAPAPYASFLHELERRRSPYLHWWYSFSKDFGVSGLRCGALYTRNAALAEAFGNLGAPHTVSNHTQWLLEDVLGNDAWVAAFAKTNRAHLTDAYADTVGALRELGLPYRAARGSLFAWFAASPLRRGGETDGALWRRLFRETGLLLTSPTGFGLGDERAGWLRGVITCVDDQTRAEALRRLRQWANT